MKRIYQHLRSAKPANNSSPGLNLRSRRGNALIMIVLMFALLLVLGTGAGVLASVSSHSSIRETKNEQASIAARSVALAIKDEIENAADPQALINSLKSYSSADSSHYIQVNGAGALAETVYSLEVVEVDPLVTFKISATYQNATETYNVVFNKTENIVSDPTYVEDLFFSSYWPGNNAFTADIAANITIVGSASNSTNTVNSSITLVDDDGEVYNLQSGANIVTRGTITGNVVALGNVQVDNHSLIDGNIYTMGNVTIANHGEVTGSIYAMGSVNSKKTENVVSNPQNNPEFISRINKLISIVYDNNELASETSLITDTSSYTRFNFDSLFSHLPDALIYDQDYVDEANLSTQLELGVNSKEEDGGQTLVIYDHTVLSAQVRRSPSSTKALSSYSRVRFSNTNDDDLPSSTNDIYYPDGLYITVNRDWTIDNKIFETEGKVVIVLGENYDIEFKNRDNSMLVSNDYESGGKLQTYIYGLNNNAITFEGKKLHAFVFANGSSAQFNSQSDNIDDKEIVGLLQINNMAINATYSDVIFASPGAITESEVEPVTTTEFSFVGTAE